MTDKQKKILENFSNVIPLLPESEQNYLLGYGDALAVLNKVSGSGPEDSNALKTAV